MLQNQLSSYYAKNYPNLKPPVVSISDGRRYYKIIVNNSAWGFVAKSDGVNKGVPYFKWDLFKAQSWSSPAKWARGNITDSNTTYTVYGPHYL